MEALKGNACTCSCGDAEVRTSVLLTYTQSERQREEGRWGGGGGGREPERFKKLLPCNEVKSANCPLTSKLRGLTFEFCPVKQNGKYVFGKPDVHDMENSFITI